MKVLEIGLMSGEIIDLRSQELENIPLVSVDEPNVNLHSFLVKNEGK